MDLPPPSPTDAPRARHQLTRTERRRGGFRSHLRGRAHEWTQEEARRAGLKSAAQRAAARCVIAVDSGSSERAAEFFTAQVGA
jgi:hypothetical protein